MPRRRPPFRFRIASGFTTLGCTGDSRTLLFVNAERMNIWKQPALGGPREKLTPDWNPRWSPDGTTIVFYGYRTGNRDLWVMPSGGGPARQLTSHPARDWFPSWSPR